MIKYQFVVNILFGAVLIVSMIIAWSRDEIAFYCVLTADDAVKQFMKDDVLKKIAHELTATIRKNITIDWSIRKSAQAGMRRIIKSDILH